MIMFRGDIDMGSNTVASNHLGMVKTRLNYNIYVILKYNIFQPNLISWSDTKQLVALRCESRSPLTPLSTQRTPHLLDHAEDLVHVGQKSSEVALSKND